ncbi:MAG: ImmA/IrrE family metallo-endopeptidase [bacterium]|nr:ImmA/IrrE family metallo-endopeptidase [bacterium]
MKLKVPFRSISEIESMVFDLLYKYEKHTGGEIRPPIDVDGVAESYLGVDLEVVDLQELINIPDVLGAAWFEDNVIRIDSTLENKEGRFSFTLAHEIAHWWIHRPIIEMEKVELPLFPHTKGEAAKPAVVCRSSAGNEPAEWQANQFAGRLLMPDSFVREAARQISDKLPISIKGIETSRKRGEVASGLRRVAGEIASAGKFTNVSVQAMSIRLTDLKIVVDSDNPQQLLF